MPIWSVCVLHIAHVFEQHFRMPANVGLTSNVTGFDSVHALFVVCATKNSCGFHFWIFLHFPSSRHIKTFDFIFRFVCLLRSQISIIWSRNPLDFWFVIRKIISPSSPWIRLFRVWVVRSYTHGRKGIEKCSRK